MLIGGAAIPAAYNYINFDSMLTELWGTKKDPEGLTLKLDTKAPLMTPSPLPYY